MLMQILTILVPSLILGGFFALLFWVGKRLLVDRKRVGGACQMLAQQTLYDLQTDQGRQALVEATEAEERGVSDEDGDKL